MAKGRESGRLGQLHSLGGLWSRQGIGRVAEPQNLTVTTTEVLGILSANQGRISALIINKTGGTLTLDLGNTGTYSIVIASGGNFQIDDNFPWTLSVSAIAEGANCTVWVLEVYIEQLGAA